MNCTACNGNGEVDCPDCSGRLRESGTSGDCPRCGGRAVIECLRCSGSGFLELLQE